MAFTQKQCELERKSVTRRRCQTTTLFSLVLTWHNYSCCLSRTKKILWNFSHPSSLSADHWRVELMHVRLQHNKWSVNSSLGEPLEWNRWLCQRARRLSDESGLFRNIYKIVRCLSVELVVRWKRTWEKVKPSWDGAHKLANHTVSYMTLNGQWKSTQSIYHYIKHLFWHINYSPLSQWSRSWVYKLWMPKQIAACHSAVL